MEQTSFKNSKLLRITNVGNFDDSNYFRVELPKYALITPNQQVFTLTNNCHSYFCSFELLKITDNTCLQNLMANSTDTCHKIYQEPPAFCEQTKFGQNLLVSATRGSFLKIINGNPVYQQLNRTSVLLEEQGTLTCLSASGVSVTIIVGEEEAKRSQIAHPITIMSPDPDLASSGLLLSLAELSESIEDLEFSDDKILVGNNYVPTLALFIAVIGFIILLFSCYTLRKCSSKNIFYFALKLCRSKYNRTTPRIKDQSGCKIDRRVSFALEYPKDRQARPESIIALDPSDYLA